MTVECLIQKKKSQRAHERHVRNDLVMTKSGVTSNNVICSNGSRITEDLIEDTSWRRGMEKNGKGLANIDGV